MKKKLKFYLLGVSLACSLLFGCGETANETETETEETEVEVDSEEDETELEEVEISEAVEPTVQPEEPEESEDTVEYDVEKLYTKITEFGKSFETEGYTITTTHGDYSYASALTKDKIFYAAVVDENKENYIVKMDNSNIFFADINANIYIMDDGVSDDAFKSWADAFGLLAQANNECVGQNPLTCAEDTKDENEISFVQNENVITANIKCPGGKTVYVHIEPESDQVVGLNIERDNGVSLMYSNTAYALFEGSDIQSATPDAISSSIDLFNRVREDFSSISWE